jgi:hypothetical protein
MYKGLTLTIVCLLLGTGLIFGQDDAEDMNQQNDAITVVTYYKCDYSKMQDAIKMINETNAPILKEFVDDGKLYSWGVLNHLWGDEWNLIVYYNAKSLSSFEKTFEEMFARIMEKDPDFMDTWSGMCSEHKDNIYSVVSSYSGSE